jgi:hypothetical protein
LELLEEIFEAFGERMSLLAWSRDRRSVVSHLTLAARMDAGWELERALTIPPIKNIRQLEKLVTAFGQTKTLLEWGSDPRAKVPSRTILWRIRRGWESAEAITQAPPQAPAVRSVRKTPVQYEAFGDKNTLRGWLEDARCQVKREKLLRSLAQGLSMEESLTTGGEDGRRKRGRPIVEKQVGTLEDALSLLAQGGELWHAQTPEGSRSSLLKGNTRYEVTSEHLDALIERGLVELVFDTPTIAEYRVSESGKRAAC